MLPIIAPETRIILRFLFYFIAKTKPNISFYLGKQKHIFLCLGKQLQIFVHLQKQTKCLCLAWENKKYFLSLRKTEPDIVALVE